MKQELAVVPGSPLDRLLADQRLDRPTRRAVLAAVQAKGPRQKRLVRAANRMLRERGVRPA